MEAYTTPARSVTVHARLTPRDADRVRAAAALTGLTVSKLVSAASSAAASKILEREAAEGREPSTREV